MVDGTYLVILVSLCSKKLLRIESVLDHESVRNFITSLLITLEWTKVISQPRELD